MTLGTHVHHPLAHWAHTRPHAVALASESQRLTFADLHARVQQRAAQLATAQAPATVLLPGTGGVVHTLVEFLAVLAAGRCAAVGDPAWPAPIAQSVQAAIAALPPLVPPPAPGQEPFYIGFTSGSSGMPKGFRRHHQSWVESFRVSQHDFGEAMAGRIVAPGSLTASLFLFGALLGLWTGAGSVVQEHFSAERTLRDLASAPATVLVAVPSQLLLMLQWAQRRHCAPVAQVQLVLISGARWMREHTPALRQLFPQARIVEFYGASEASYVAWMDASEDAPPQAVGRPFSNVALRIGEHPHTAVPQGEAGRIWVRSPMLFMDYVHAIDGSAAVQEDGWLSVRDMGWLDAQGLLHLCGRESRMLVTQGKNLFPEEVEARLLAHPAIAQASVLGLPDPLRGMRVHAVLAAAPGQTLPNGLALAQWCRHTLEAYKAPRQWWLWHGPWPHTRSGKTDHTALAAALAAAVRPHLAQPSGHGTPPSEAAGLHAWR